MNYLRINSCRLVFVAMTMLISSALKAEIKTGPMGENVSYTWDTESGEVVISGTGEMWDCSYGYGYFSPFCRDSKIVKGTIGEGITNISPRLFSGCSSLASVEIPESVTSIGEWAFDNCSSLTSIVVPSSVTNIGYMAFAGTPWINTYITDISNHWGNIVYINNVAYQAISKDIQNCEFKQGTTSICHGAFSGCTGLTSIEIPSGVTSIGDYAFSGCSSLTKIEIPSSVTSIGHNTFSSTPWYNAYKANTNNHFGNIIYINDVAYEAISTDIQNCEFKQGTISIADHAFEECRSLKSIEIPSSVTSIGNKAFSGCTGLTSIEIPSNSKLMSIGDYAFLYASLKTVKIPANVKKIGFSAFPHWDDFNPIEKVEIVSIESLLNIQFAQDSTYFSLYSNPLSNGAHLYMNGEEVVDVVIPEGVKKINKFAFIGAKYIRSITLPQSLEFIGDWAFYGCTSLRSITFPSNVTYIGNGVLYGCTLSINNQSNCVSVNNWAAKHAVDYFTEDGLGIRDNTVLTCVQSATSVRIPEGVISIAKGAFIGCTSLTSIDFPSSVTSIGDCAFQNCSALTTMEIPLGVESIGYKAFDSTPWYNSYKENTNNHFGNIIYINDVAYEATSRDIQNCEFKQGTISIADNAFQHCSSLTSIEIPSSVANIGNSAFDGCTSLTSVTIPSSITSIGGSTFYGCSSLTSVTIPSSVTSIGNYAFGWCTRLTSIYVGNTPPNIATYTFYGSIKNNCILYVPYGHKSAYQNAPEWKKFTNIVEYDTPTDISQYEDILYVESAEAATGRTATLSIQLNNVKALTGFQGDIVLPEGCSFVFDEYGYAEAELTEARTNSKVMSFDTQEQEDGSLRILVYSSKNIAFTGNEGEVATVTIEVDSELEDGEYLIQLKNIVLTEASGKTIEIEKVISTLTVFSYALGDANGDRKVNVGDLAATASHILGNTPDNFIAKAADANEDTKINVGDLAKIAGIILGTANTAPQRATAIGESCFEANMYVELVEDNEYLLHVGINNDGVNFSGFQFDLQLPEGLNVCVDAYGYAEAELSTSRTTARRTDIFDSAFMEDGSLRVLCASTSNAMFEGESGDVAIIRLVADESFAGEGLLSLTQIFYTATGEGLEAVDVVMDFQNAISSIHNISMSIASKVYDMNGVVVGTTADIESLPKGIYVVSGKKVVK